MTFWTSFWRNWTVVAPSHQSLHRSIAHTPHRLCRQRRRHVGKCSIAKAYPPWPATHSQQKHGLNAKQFGSADMEDPACCGATPMAFWASVAERTQVPRVEKVGSCTQSCPVDSLGRSVGFCGTAPSFGSNKSTTKSRSGALSPRTQGLWRH